MNKLIVIGSIFSAWFVITYYISEGHPIIFIKEIINDLLSK